MLQVYADKNGSDLGQKPDPGMRIKMGAGESRPDSCADKSRPAGIEPMALRLHKKYFVSQDMRGGVRYMTFTKL